jgi:integrase
MPKPLTDATIRNAKLKDKRYRMRDGHGLYLEVSPAGGRHWRYRWEMPTGETNEHGKPVYKEQLFSIGEWCAAPDGETDEQAAARRAARRFTLAEARAERQRCRDMIKRGQHPLAAKKAEKLAQQHSSANTFKAVAEELIDKHPEWSAVHRARFVGFLERDAYPDLGALPIRDVTALNVLAVLRKVEKRGALSMALAGRGVLGQVFKYGIATGRCAGNPAADTVGAIQTAQTEHHRPLSHGEISEFFAVLGAVGLGRTTELALRLLAYTFARPGELRGARWAEFDFEAAEWRIPARRMKKRTDHVVPLSTQAVALLRDLRTLTGGSEWLLPHSREPRKCMAKGALLSAINRVTEKMGGLEFTPHGFRATASTLLHETGVESKLIELQLAHQERNKSRASYDHAARLPERREMMQSYADLLDELMRPKSNVVPLRAASEVAI